MLLSLVKRIQMHRLVSLFIAVSCLSLCACAPLLVAGGTAGGYYVGQDERTVKTIANDASITASIKAKLINDRSIKAFAINVDTRNGIVTLNGSVPKITIEDKAISLVSQVRGVKKISSKLIIEELVESHSQP